MSPNNKISALEGQLPNSLSNSRHRKTFDELLSDSIGSFGRYQLVQFSLLCLPTLFVAMHVMSWTFVIAPVSKICDKNETEFSNCTETGGYSAIDKWDISEENSWIKACVQALYFFGQMAGSFACGIMADKLGRKKVFILSVAIQTISGLMLIWAPWWWLYAIFKAGTGFAQPGVYGVAIVLGMELVGANFRSLGSVVANLVYALGEILLAVIAYFVTDYRILHAVIAIPPLLFFSYWWIIHESARWLVSKERFDEAESILHQAAKMNRKPIPQQWFENIERTTSSSKSFGATDLVRTPKMRQRTLACFLLWPVTTMMYYGMTMKSDLGGGNLYVNFIVSAAMELPAILFAYWTIDRIGRKPLVSGGLFIAGVALVVKWAIGDTLSYEYHIVQMMIAKGAVTTTYTAMYTYTSELFPTVIRNTAVGCCSTIARFGAIASAFISFFLVERYGALAMVIPFSLLSLLASITSWTCLPETMNKNMPESISEIEGQDL